MVNCGSCGRKLTLFEKKYDYLDEDDTPIKYCKKCHLEWIENKKQKRQHLIMEKRKDKIQKEESIKNQEEQLIKNLNEEKLIEKYVVKVGLHFIVSPNKVAVLPDILLEINDSFTEFVDNPYILDKKNIVGQGNTKLYLDGKYKLCQGILILKNKKLYFLLSEYGDSLPIYVLESVALQTSYEINGFYRTAHLVKTYHVIPIELMQILFKKYGDFKVKFFFQSLIKHTSNIIYGMINHICEEYKTKDAIYTGIIDKFNIDKLPPNSNLILEILFETMKKRNLTDCTNAIELFNDIKMWQEENNIKNFEKSLVQDKKLYSIEDVDLMNGFEFEAFLSRLFTNMGYKVEQTKLSGDQGADLVIERNNRKTVIQAKRYSGKVSNSAVQEIVASIKHYKADSGMIVTNSQFTSSAIQLAKSNDIRLVDREKLKELIQTYF